MVLSQTSVLGKLSGTTRRVTLITDPTYSNSTGSWLVNGLDADKQQWQIDLTVLPPGVTKDMIKSGQKWFIERSTTYNRLYKYVGEFTPYSHTEFSNDANQYINPNDHILINFNQYEFAISGTCGPIKTINHNYTYFGTSEGTLFIVPLPGLYSIDIQLNGSFDSFGIVLANSSSFFGPPYPPYFSQTFVISSGSNSTLNSKYNCSLGITATSSVSGMVGFGGFVGISYVGSIPTGAQGY